jgi:hypothetical protein
MFLELYLKDNQINSYPYVINEIKAQKYIIFKKRIRI